MNLFKKFFSLFKKETKISNTAIDAPAPFICNGHFWSEWKKDNPEIVTILFEEKMEIQYRECLICNKLDWYNKSLKVPKKVLSLYDNPWKKQDNE